MLQQLVSRDGEWGRHEDRSALFWRLQNRVPIKIIHVTKRLRQMPGHIAPLRG